MRPVLAALVVVLLAFALGAPAALAEAPAAHPAEAPATVGWWQELIATVWSAVTGGSGTDATAPAGAPTSDADHGPTMDPDG